MKKTSLLLLFIGLIFLGKPTAAQDPVLFQNFYWDVPAGGNWWNTIAGEAENLADAGVDMVWFPSPFKGFGGAFDMGYGIYDHFDAGEFLQNGTTETRFGSRAELQAAIQAYQNAGHEVICDVILNHTIGGNLEDNPYLEDYIVNRGWYPVMPYDKYMYVYQNALPGRYYVQISGNQNDHSQTGYDDREGYYSVRPWYSHSSGQNADGQPGVNEWDIGDGDSGPFDAFEIDLPGRVMEGQINGVGDVDEYYIDHTGGWLEFRLTSTDQSGQRDLFINQLFYDPNISISGDEVDATALLKIQTYTNLMPASGRFPKDYRNYYPNSGAGQNDIAETYHFPYFGNDLCYPANGLDFNTGDSLIAWGEWLTNTLGFDGYRFDLAKGIDPAYMATWINQPAMSGRFYVGEHWSGPTEIKDWVDQVNAGITGSRQMTGFDFPLFYALKDFCNNTGYDARNLHSAGLHPLYGNGVNVTTFVHNHDVFRPYTSAHDPIINNAEDAYAYILTHPGTATVFYPDYYGATFFNADSSESLVMPGQKSEIDNLLAIRKRFAAGPLHLLTQDGSPDYKPGDDRFASGDFSSYATSLYIAQREGATASMAGSGLIVVLNNHPTDAVGAWVTVQGNGVGASFLRDQTGNRSGITEIFTDNRVFVHAGPQSYAVWADSSVNLTTPVVKLKGFLEGPYLPASGEMSTILEDNALLPLSHPYGGAPWNHGGSEQVVAIPDGVTDWVLVELRTGTSAASRVATRAGFIMSDGSVVDLDGSSPLAFEVPDANYYAALFHRNHLAVMSAGPMAVNNTSAIMDLRLPANTFGGTAALKQMSDGQYALFGGDANSVGDVDVLDLNIHWRPNNGTAWNYNKFADFNLDGGIDVLDLNIIWRPNKGLATQLP